MEHGLCAQGAHLNCKLAFRVDAVHLSKNLKGELKGGHSGLKGERGQTTGHVKETVVCLICRLLALAKP